MTFSDMKLFTKIKVAIFCAALISLIFAVPVQAQEDTLDTAALSQDNSNDTANTVALMDWHVSPIVPENEKARRYCAMAGEYGGGTIITHARNNFGLGTIAFDLPDVVLTRGQKYRAKIEVGDKIERRYAATAASDSLLVVKVGNDLKFYNELFNGASLTLKLDGGFPPRTYKNRVQSFEDFQSCLADLPRPNKPRPVVVNVPIIEKKVIKSPPPIDETEATKIERASLTYQDSAAEEPPVVEKIVWLTEEVKAERKDRQRKIDDTNSDEALQPKSGLGQDELTIKAMQDARISVERIPEDIENPRNRTDSQSVGTDLPISRISDVSLKSILAVAGMKDPKINTPLNEKGLITWTAPESKGIEGSVQHLAIFSEMNLMEFVITDVDSLETACRGQFSAEIGPPEQIGGTVFSLVETTCFHSNIREASAHIYQLSPELMSIWTLEGPLSQRNLLQLYRSNLYEILSQRAELSSR